MAEFAVNAFILKQKGQSLYCFGMSSTLLREICYVTPRSHDDPEEIQRILNPRRAKDIGEYVKQANSLLPSALVVSLTADVSIESTGDKGVAVVRFPADHGKFAYILDGQHRLEGFKYSDGIVFDLPVVALHNADDSLRGKIFADINSKQVAVSDVHLLSLYYQIKDLPVEETPVMDVIDQLNKDPDSPLKGLIQMMDTDKGMWIKNSALKKWLSPHLTSGGVLATKHTAEKAVIVKNYFRAIAQLWPEAWGDRKGHNLCLPIGFEILLSIFGAAKQRCDLNCGKQYTADNFAKQLEPLRDAMIDVPQIGTFKLDWERGSMGFLSNRAGRSLITRQLNDLLRMADEDKTA
jgi:DGQHR domain-containing protein